MQGAALEGIMPAIHVPISVLISRQGQEAGLSCHMSSAVTRIKRVDEPGLAGITPTFLSPACAALDNSPVGDSQVLRHDL